MTISFIGIVDGSDEVVSKAIKYANILEMLGIKLRLTATTNFDIGIGRNTKSSRIFLHDKDAGGYVMDVNVPIVERRIIFPPTPLAVGVSKKYSTDYNEQAVLAATAHALAGYSLKTPSDLIVVYYPHGSKPKDPRLWMLKKFHDSKGVPIINFVADDFFDRLMEHVTKAGYGSIVTMDGWETERMARRYVHS